MMFMAAVFNGAIPVCVAELTVSRFASAQYKPNDHSPLNQGKEAIMWGLSHVPARVRMLAGVAVAVYFVALLISL
jgi:hypothetical protein